MSAPRSIDFGNSVTLVLPKRVFNDTGEHAGLITRILFEGKYLFKITGLVGLNGINTPFQLEELIHEHIIDPGIADLPLRLNNRYASDKYGKIHYYHHNILSGLMSPQWALSLNQHNLQDPSYFQEDNPLGIPTYREIANITRRYYAIHSIGVRAITNTRINPHKNQQDEIWESRWQGPSDTVYLPPYQRKNLWAFTLPEGIIPGGPTKVRLRESPRHATHSLALGEEGAQSF